MNIELIEERLKIGQVSPDELAKMKDWLAVESSSLMDRQDQLIDLYADYFHAQREFHKSDKACDNAWNIREEGREQRKLETYQKRIKVLREAISSHLRVAHDQTYNNH